MVNVLDQGSASIRKVMAEAEKLGLTFSRKQARQVEQANDAMERMRGIMTGLANQIAIQFAPFVEAAANKLTEMATSGRTWAQRTVDGFEWVMKAAAYVADGVNLIKAGFYALASGADTAIATILDGMEFIKTGVLGATATILTVTDRILGGLEALFAVFSSGLQTAVGKLAGWIATAVAEYARLAKSIPGIGDEMASGLSKAAASMQEWSDELATGAEQSADRAREIYDRLVSGRGMGGALDKLAQESAAAAEKSWNRFLDKAAGQEWAEQAQENARKAVDAYRGFQEGSMQERVKAFFEGIRNSSAQAAKDAQTTSDKLKAGLTGAAGATMGRMGPQRAAALERGTMAAFSASLPGLDSLEKDSKRSLREQQEINRNTARTNDLLGAVIETQVQVVGIRA
jgi:hypothetical protein